MCLRHCTMVLGLLTVCVSSAALAAEMPGVTPTSNKIGSVFPFSGPASLLGNTGKGRIAYVKKEPKRLRSAAMRLKEAPI
jgi:hypothetical protein